MKFSCASITMPLLVVTLGRLRNADSEASIDLEVSTICQNFSCVGLTSWSVNGDGDLCSLGVTGERIKGSGEPLVTTGDSRHHIGSATKSMTAVLVAILIEKGNIKNGWDATMRSLVPEAEDSPYENVTLRELVGMLSGIANVLPENTTYPPLDRMLSGIANFAPENTTFPPFDPSDIRSFRRAASIAAFESTPVEPPGTAFVYSSWAYVVLGHIVENLTGTTWEDALATLLFEPLGIDLGSPQNYTGAPNNNVDPWGHIGDDQIPCDPNNDECDIPAVLGPAGTFSGPVAAVARYLSWHVQCHNGNIPDDDPAKLLLSQESCQQIHQPANASLSPYGYGLICVDEPRAGGYMCWHNGSNDRNYFLFWLVFHMNRAFASYTNGARRTNREDGRMAEEAVLAAINGEQECVGPIPSSYYTETTDDTSTAYRVSYLYFGSGFSLVTSLFFFLSPRRL